MDCEFAPGASALHWLEDAEISLLHTIVTEEAYPARPGEDVPTLTLPYVKPWVPLLALAWPLQRQVLTFTREVLLCKKLGDHLIFQMEARYQWWIKHIRTILQV